MKSHNRTRSSFWMTFVASAAFCAIPAFAQQQLNTSASHVSDANNRVGSGGFNDAVPSQQANPTGNQIATGNVSSGFAFRGISVNGINLGSGLGDPNSFGGIIPGTGIDQFNANSTGVPTMANPNASSSYLANGARPYYGQSQTVSAPAGYTPLPNGGGFVPMSPTAVNGVNLADTRVGLTTYGDTSTTVLPKPGQVFLPGPVDPTAAPSMYSASPLYGVQQWQTNMPGQNSTSSLPTANSSQFAAPMDPTQQQYNQQNQLIRQQLSTTTANPLPANQQSSGYLPPLTPTGTASGQALQPLQPSPGGQTQVVPQSISPVAGQLSTSQGTRSYLDPMNLPSATLQSAQYAELRRRMDQYNTSHPQTDEEANRQFRQLLQAQRALSNSNGTPSNNSGSSGTSPSGINNSGPVTPAAPSATTPPTLPAPTPAPSAAAPAPLQIQSLATGVNSSALADLLHQGEDQIKNQQYDEAIRVFDNAERAVPNNPLILIGRAEAELGGSYYRQAELDLREAFRQDNAVLLGQYDLHKYLGDDRLQFITTSLKQISSESPENAVAPFLLAYVFYNTHQESQASDWLNEADKRTGGSDEVLILLKRYWSFKSSAPTTQP